MSDAPQGPGWWLASDGKYYPPAQGAAPAVPAPPPAPAPGPPPITPPGYNPGQPMMGAPMQPGIQPMPVGPVKKKGNGCLYAVIIFIVLSIVGSVVFFLVIRNAVNESVGSLSCDFISQEKADEIMGSTVSIYQEGSLTAGLGTTLDDRILPGKAGCTLSTVGSPAAPKPSLGSLNKLEKSDAAAFFKTELDKAKAGSGTAPSSTISTPSIPGLSIPDIPTSTGDGPYFLKDAGLGDESFCTKANFFDASGVLVRKGNTIVYATVTAGTNSDFNADYSESNCEYAKKLAEAALSS